jgi:hypothetical protein
MASIEIVAGSGTGASMKLWVESTYGEPAMKVGFETLPVKSWPPTTTHL